MCGIAGIITYPNKKPEVATLEKMRKALSHRGPDGEGTSIAGNVALTMRRLSIIDVAGGDQPLYNEDKSIVIVGNGEIYNYIELAKVLKHKGHKFRTGSDIEIAAHAYEEWGLECPKKFRGQYALAIHDQKRARVVLIRDKMGEKPLYYTKVKEGIAFASEMKALLTINSFKKKLNFDAVNLYFHFYFVPEPETMFKGVRKLPAGSLIVIDLATLSAQEKSYWDPTKIQPIKVFDPTKKIKEIFADSCEFALRADVPVGISLSGGIDSGSILAFSAPKYKKTMKAISIGYEGYPASDEREMAKKLAKKFKVEFIELEIKKGEAIEYFPHLVWDADDPIADIASYSIYSVSKLARKHKIKVLLGGVGGDELFWGYPSTIEATIENVSKLGGGLRPLFGKSHFSYNNPNPKTTGILISKLYSKNFSEKTREGNYLRFLDWGKLRTKLEVAKHSMDLVRDVWLKGDVITLADRLSMASSVEMRSPFLDYQFVETILSSKKAVGGYNLGPKYWFKKAMQGVVPNEVLNRPKRGFTPPVADWVDGIIKNYSHLIDGGFLIKEGILDSKKTKPLISLLKYLPLYSLYQLILMEIWGREYVYNIAPKDIK